MIDNKQFLKGFLEYLQSYYGQSSDFGMGDTPMYPNQPRLSLFQTGMNIPGETEMMPEEEMMGQQGMMGAPMVQQPMGSMNQMPALPGETLGQELNGMFPGPYDPVRMG